MATEGWSCPGCGRCYAPWMPQCTSCGQRATFSSPQSTCIHDVDGQPDTTFGRQCRKCGIYVLDSTSPDSSWAFSLPEVPS